MEWIIDEMKYVDLMDFMMSLCVGIASSGL
jgi:hypothetical protein